jgi:hypothetical protein
MTAIRPNLNFDNEKRNIVPFREVLSGTVTPEDQFMKPKPATVTKKTKTKKQSEPVATTMNRWFTKR